MRTQVDVEAYYYGVYDGHCGDNTAEYLKHKLLSMSGERYLLADHTKFGVRGLTKFAELSDLTELITDKKTPAAVMKELESRGVKVLVG